MATANVELLSRDGARLFRKTVFLAAVDGLAILAGFTIVLGLLEFRPQFVAAGQLTRERIALDLLIALVLILHFRRSGHYTERRPFWQEAGEVILAFGVALLIDAAGMFFLKLTPSRLSVLGYWTVGGSLLLTGRWIVKSWLVARGLWSMPAVIVGTGQNARDLAVALLDDPVPAYRPVAFMTPLEVPSDLAEVEIENGWRLPVVSAFGNPFTAVSRFGRCHVVIALELEEFPKAKEFVDRLSHAHKDLEIVLPFRGMPTRRSYQTRWMNHDLTAIRVAQTMNARWQNLMKRVFDIAIAGSLMLFLGPLFLILCGLVGTTGRPLFFAHERIGRHGRSFRCLKFRTMAVDAEARLRHILATDPLAAVEWHHTRKLKNDPRITSIGHFLRKTSLDELPQLINVLKGEMSLVGPRPVTAEEVEWYGEDRIHYLQAWPGITGLWQVSGRNQLDFKRRVRLDAWYVQNWSLLRDIAILLMTVRVVFSRDGAY
jgi:undecaprenyl-phosphate galactose phosphotransferase